MAINREHGGMRALFIPADFNQAPVVADIKRHDIEMLVGGAPEAASYDHNVTTWVNATGRVNGLPANLGASDYTAQYSKAGRDFEMANGFPPAIQLHGNVVITGVDGSDVPQRILDEWPNAKPQNTDDLLRQVDEAARRQQADNEDEERWEAFTIDDQTYEKGLAELEARGIHLDPDLDEAYKRGYVKAYEFDKVFGNLAQKPAQRSQTAANHKDEDFGYGY